MESLLNWVSEEELPGQPRVLCESVHLGSRSFPGEKGSAGLLFPGGRRGLSSRPVVRPDRGELRRAFSPAPSPLRPPSSVGLTSAQKHCFGFNFDSVDFLLFLPLSSASGGSEEQGHLPSPPSPWPSCRGLLLPFLVGTPNLMARVTALSAAVDSGNRGEDTERPKGPFCVCKTEAMEGEGTSQGGAAGEGSPELELLSPAGQAFSLPPSVSVHIPAQSPNATGLLSGKDCLGTPIFCSLWPPFALWCTPPSPDVSWAKTFPFYPSAHSERFQGRIWCAPSDAWLYVSIPVSGDSCLVRTKQFLNTSGEQDPCWGLLHENNYGMYCFRWFPAKRSSVLWGSRSCKWCFHDLKPSKWSHLRVWAFNYRGVFLSQPAPSCSPQPYSKPTFSSSFANSFSPELLNRRLSELCPCSYPVSPGFVTLEQSHLLWKLCAYWPRRAWL